jgi:hypothetical protein
MRKLPLVDLSLRPLPIYTLPNIQGSHAAIHIITKLLTLLTPSGILKCGFKGVQLSSL